MRAQAYRNLLMASLSGLLLGFAFPPSPFYSLAYIAFIPFFFLFERVNTFGQLARYSYVFALVFHIVIVYWTGGFTHRNDPYLMVAGSTLIIVHPLLYLPSILMAFVVRRHLGSMLGLFSFIFLWIGFEYVHSLSEISFPWMTIGNSQAFDLYRIQIAEYTSAYGLSFLLLAFNALAYVWVVRTTTGKWELLSRPSLISSGCLVLLYVIPWVYGRSLIGQYSIPTTDASVRIGLIQPNIDPWKKWGESLGSALDTYERQLQLHLDQTRMFKADSVDLVLWCETAIPFHILDPRWRSTWNRVRSMLDSEDTPVLTGFPYVEYFDSAQAPVTAHRIQNTNVYYEDYNSVMLISPHSPVGSVYKKIRLVPFAERIPYAESLRFLIEPLRWSVGISGWGLGKDTVLFEVLSRKGKREQFGGMICYESVFPDFVRQFVRKGAKFLIVLTNDSWWGNTSGAYQHMSFTSLRAVETRRWVIQCANGGISGFTDPAGRIHQETSMYTMARISRDIEPRSESTFYVRHGDVFAVFCLVVAIVFVAIGLYSSLSSRKRGL